MSIAIQVQNLSKAYQLGQIGTGTISHDLERFFVTKILRKEDPFLKIGEANDRSTKGTSDVVWSLKDLNFDIQAGDAVGIIGKNGAGKSTLLKLLSRVTSPTTGSIKVKGRIASLLEVGTGFHPELTGRENIFLNGAILGMRHHEIKSKFDEIVDFSGVERYIDTPVKRYSSGMYVRLAFAVAAHLESEILIVDEVLAVGDAEFQKKCLGKMNDVSKGQGRTVLFVSHNMAAVKSLCTKGMLLEKGNLKYSGDAINTVGNYFKGEHDLKNKILFKDEYKTDVFNLIEVSINSLETPNSIILDEYQEIELHTKIEFFKESENKHVTYVISNEQGELMFTFSYNQTEIRLTEGQNHLICRFPKGFLNIGTYYLHLYIIENNKSPIFDQKDIFTFDIQEGERPVGAWMGREPGFIKPKFDWIKK